MDNQPKVPDAGKSEPQIATLLQQGLALHQKGNPEEAQVIYEQILSIQPNHFDALQLLGVLFAQIKEYSKAVKFLSKALEINPNHAGAFSNRGIALKGLKRFDEALASYDQAIAINPVYLDAYTNRGNTLQELKRFDEALASFDQAIAINPDYAEAYYNRGNTLQELKRFDEALISYDQAIAVNLNSAEIFSDRGVALKKLKRFDEALASYDQAIAINPDYAEACSNRGNVLQELKRFDEALVSYSQAIAINPDYAEAYGNRGTALQGLKRFDEALVSYDQAIAINPDYAEAYSNRGTALQGLKRFDEALNSCNHAIAIDPNCAEAYSNIGSVLQGLKRFDEALNSCNHAIAIDPNCAEAYSNIGSVLQGLKRFDEALVSYDQAIKVNPDLATAHHNLSLCNLKKGNFSEGWQGYEWRWLDHQFDSERLKSDNPAWNYQKTDERLLVWAEQGVGDHIFYGSLLLELLEDVPNLLVQVDKRLLSIFTRSLPKIKFYAADFKLAESDYDVHVPIGSLGKYLRSDKKYFLRTKNRFLKDDELKTAEIKKDLVALTPSNHKICGISWTSQSEGTGVDKSTTLKYFIETLDLEGYTFVNLQYGDTKDEIQKVRKELGVNIISYDEVDNFMDIDGLSSLIQACDTVITIDNVTCQLAGALGKETHILLSFDPWWGWMIDSNKSPWHPSLNLYRQEKINDWDGAFKKLKIAFF